MTVTAWTPHAIGDPLPAQTFALQALYLLRGERGRVRVPWAHLTRTLEGYGHLTNQPAGTRRRVSHGGTHSYRAAVMILPTPKGQVVVFDDHSALGLRHRGQGFCLPGTVFLNSLPRWTIEDATYAMETLWVPGRPGPRRLSDWNHPSVGMEMVMPIKTIFQQGLSRSFEARAQALRTVVEVLWCPRLPRSALTLYQAEGPDGVSLRLDLDINDHPTSSFHQSAHLMVHLARVLFPGRWREHRTWRNYSAHANLTVHNQAFFHLPVRPAMSAHERMEAMRALQASFPGVYAELVAYTQQR